MSYLKHNSNRKSAQKRAAKKPEDGTRVVVTGPDTPAHLSSPALQHEINHVAGMDGIEASLDWIARSLGRVTDDDNTVGVVLGQNRYAGPVKITFADNDEEDTVDRLVTAFERMADSVAKLAGLSRPRLERWHEQSDYQPRYRDSACDGGAPGAGGACGEASPTARQFSQNEK